MKISIGGAEATLLQLEIEPVVRYLTSLFDEGGLNKERTLGWAQELLNRGESSLLVKLKGKMILLTYLASIETMRAGPVASEAMRGTHRGNFLKFLHIAVAWSVLSHKANSKALLLTYFQKSDAVDNAKLWVQTGVKRKSDSKPWYGNQSCLVKMARVSYLKQVFHMKWTCTQQEQEGAAEFTWDVLSLQEKESRSNANKQQLGDVSRRLFEEGKETFMKVFPGKFKNWISQSGPGGGIRLKKELTEQMKCNDTDS